MPHSSLFKKISQPCSPHPGFPAEISKNATACYTKPKVNISSTKPLKSPLSCYRHTGSTDSETQGFFYHTTEGAQNQRAGHKAQACRQTGQALERVS